jgi:hypothetical protein
MRLFGLVFIGSFIISAAAVTQTAHAFDFSVAGVLSTLQNSFTRYLVPTKTVPYATVYVPPKSDSVVYAQTAGFGGGSGMLVTHYKEVTPPGGTAVGGNAALCPSGWTTVLEGYGPHYIGVITYGLLTNGTEQGWYDWWWYPGDPGGSYKGPNSEDPPESRPPEDPPPPAEPPPPDPFPPPDPPIPQRTYEDPPPPPEAPGPITPSGPDAPSKPGNDPAGAKPVTFWASQFFVDAETGRVKNKITSSLINEARAQVLLPGQEYFTKDIAIGSDSVCSDSENVIVPFSKMYTNILTPVTWSAESSACFTDSTSGIKTCNRCRVCIK